MGVLDGLILNDIDFPTENLLQTELEIEVAVEKRLIPFEFV